MKKLAEIIKILNDHKKELRSKFNVAEIGIFGSYVKNEQSEVSELDLLVEFREAIDLFTFVQLKNYISELLDVNVDLVMKRALKPKIGERILKDVVYL